jgi:hypothetical protein
MGVIFITLLKIVHKCEGIGSPSAAADVLRLVK